MLLTSEPMVRTDTRKTLVPHAICRMYPIDHSTRFWIADAIESTNAGLLSSASLIRNMSFTPMWRTTALGYWFRNSPFWRRQSSWSVVSPGAKVWMCLLACGFSSEGKREAGIAYTVMFTQLFKLQCDQPHRIIPAIPAYSDR